MDVSIKFGAFTSDVNAAEIHDVATTITSAECLSRRYGGPTPLVQRTSTRLLITPYWNISALCPYQGEVVEVVRAKVGHRWVKVKKLKHRFGPLTPSTDTIRQITATKRMTVKLPRKYRKARLRTQLTWFVQTTDHKSRLTVRRSLVSAPG